MVTVVQTSFSKHQIINSKLVYGWVCCLFTTQFYVSAISSSLSVHWVLFTHLCWIFFHVFFEKVVFLFTKENYLILFIRHQKNSSNSTELITEFLSFTRFFFGFSGFYFQDRRWQLIVSCSWLDLNYIINDTLLVILDAWFVRWDNRRTYFVAWQLHLPT